MSAEYSLQMPASFAGNECIVLSPQSCITESTVGVEPQQQPAKPDAVGALFIGGGVLFSLGAGALFAGHKGKQ